MKPIKLALKNITKLNKFIFIFVNLCPWILGCGERLHLETSFIVKKDGKPDDPKAYNAFLKFAWEQKNENGLHLFFFDVGHGNFILVRNKYNAIVVDAGSNNKNTVDTYIKNLFLACLGEAHLSQIIITHNHEDHTNYIDQVKKEWEKNEEIQEIKSFENQTPLSVISNVTLSFLHPLTVLQANSKNKEVIRRYENHRSSVFVLTYQGINVLFTGDATGLSLDNYVEKHQEHNNDIVAVNRELLKDIHLFVMPHHGSFTEDSFRWALYVAKHSPGLLASVICEDPHISGYQGLQTGLRDFPWPMSMRNRNINNFIYYWSRDPSQTGRNNVDKYDLHKRQTNAALFITGAEPCRCVYFKIQGGNLYKYDSTKKNFVHLNGSAVTFDELYEDNDEVVKTEHVTGEMQMCNIPMNGGGFSMNGSTQEMKTMEEIEISGIGQATEQKEMKEKKSYSNAISEDDDEENGMKEEKDMSSAFPSNVYKFQDALDDDNDYMAYAS